MSQKGTEVQFTAFLGKEKIVPAESLMPAWEQLVWLIAYLCNTFLSVLLQKVLVQIGFSLAMLIFHAWGCHNA